MNDQFGTPYERNEFFIDIRERRLILQELAGDAVYFLGAGIDLPLWIDVLVEVRAGAFPINEFDPRRSR